ncbi:integral membrane protein GPR137C [Bombina bombina]|uniref:integral membrane protein GPR137C n=1 Tax=Bombina bombina TaxID=8345 RepID=UPI00235A6F59|nr:integral membrane protein GPR137C [Bombina bombina]
MKSAIPWSVELALTVFYTVLCSALFLLIYLQLWLLLHYKQKRLSHQTLVLFICLLWVGFRTVLFSFYLKNCAQANDLQPFPHWVLYCFPVSLQFFTLCLLNLYFSQVIFKARCSPELNKYKIPLRLGFLFTSIAFLIVNLSCVLIVRNKSEDQHKWITITRIIVNECLFFACSVTLANSTYKISTMSSAYVYLESKGTSGHQAVVIGSVISVLYILRACYNLVVISTSESETSPFSYGWNGPTDHAAVEETNGLEYILFGIVFLLCELLPISLMVCFFRAKKLNQNLAAAGMVNSHSFGSRAYFFDNPRRYDSDDDLPRLAGAKGERGSLPSTPKASGWYGTICPAMSCAISPPLLSELPAGSPLLFTCGNVGSQVA